MNIFSRSPKKPIKKSDSDEDPASSRSRSPTKKKTTAAPSSPSSKSSRPREEKENYKHAQASSSRSNRSSQKSSTKSSRHTYDQNTHPLNLPPDQLRRLSALSSSMSDPDRMDLDSEGSNSNNGAPLTSPPIQSNVSAAFNPPKPNGTAAPANGEVPVPPPHKSSPTSPAAASPPTAEEAEAFKAAGNKFYKAKQYKKAIEQYTKAVEAQPSSATYLSNRAAAYISNGEYVSALDDCTRADELDPDNAKILLRLARIYLSLGRPQEALTTYARIQPPASAKDIAPAKSMLQHIGVAEDALKNGTTGSMALHALDQAEKLLGIGATKPRKWQLMRGEAYLKMGNVNALGDAQNVAMSLLRNNSADPEALVLRGRALYAQGDNDKAISHFRQALNCDPDYRDAVKYLRMVQKLDRMKGEGNADYKAGRWQAAMDKYSEALEVDPLNKGTNSKLLQNRALCRNRLKDYNGAIEDCERAISLDPSYTKAKKTKAAALGQSGNWEAAVRELKELQESDPSDGSIAKDLRNAELELKKSKRKDYYKILGVEKDADETQIKKAYRKAAIIHHPDKNRDDENAEERFKDVGEAYETLSDPQKRARYDSGEDLMDPMEGFGGGGMGGGGMTIDPEVLMQMYAQMGGGSRGGGGGFHSFGGGMPGGGGGRRAGGAPQGFPGSFPFQ